MKDILVIDILWFIGSRLLNSNSLTRHSFPHINTSTIKITSQWETRCYDTAVSDSAHKKLTLLYPTERVIYKGWVIYKVIYKACKVQYKIAGKIYQQSKRTN